MSAETPEAQRLTDFAWLRATNGGEAHGYPPIIRRLLAAYDEQATAHDEALALLEDWLVTMHHVPAEHLHTAIQQHNAKVRDLLARAKREKGDGK